MSTAWTASAPMPTTASTPSLRSSSPSSLSSLIASLSSTSRSFSSALGATWTLVSLASFTKCSGGSTVAGGVVMQRKLKNVPKQRCWMVGSSKVNNAIEMAIEFTNSWETDLRVGSHLVQHLTGGIQIVEQLQRSYIS
ncbi:hypothetical protein EUTSA_v10002943mg [Eutrema salsugineum]|uniref:Uncharacterized protein n=1 Tax=Eutrema salsugineum TaxID=72664 RepID=V4L3Z4_EUTSA|nr:hypothetical protein EUTSA_v10002943mg [Eutrema salsugineum]